MFLAGCENNQEHKFFEYYWSWYGHSILNAKKNQIPVFFKDQGTYDIWPLKDISYYVSWNIIDDIPNGIIEKKLFFRNYKPNSWIETVTTWPTQYTYMSWFFYYFTFPNIGIKISLEDASSSYFNSNDSYFFERNFFYKYNKISLNHHDSNLFLYIFQKNPNITFQKTIQQDHKFFFNQWYKIISPKEMTWRDNCRNSLINSWWMEIFILQPKSRDTLQDTERFWRFWNIDIIFILDKNHPDKYYMTSLINSLTCLWEINIEFF